ncbi:MAG: CBS domain containing-hemolysin-like protein [Bradymonadia bacterium]|jgi:CBS domain containing-hemolysin-like protein
MTLLILYIFVAIATSFLCSIMEAVLLSVSRGHVAALEQSGHPVAATLRRYKDNVDEPLAAILSLNTIAHTVGAAGAGAQAAKVFGDAWLGVFSGVLTFAILFFSEIIPKTIGALYWKPLTPIVVRSLRLLLIPMKPLVWMSGLASGLISAGHHGDKVSREELTALADLGARQGVLDPEESRIMRALLRFRSLTAADIMTPRTVVFALPSTTTSGQFVANARALRFSRVPVYETSIDHIAGYVLKDEVLVQAATDNNEQLLSALRRDMLHVHGELSVSELLERFLTSREHIACVVDEYGGTAGVATLEDVVETLLDLEIMDEADGIEDLRAAAREDWVKRATRLGLVDATGAPTRPDKQD